MRIIALSHALDSVMRHTMELLRARGHDVAVAGPGCELDCEQIKSKFTPAAISSLRRQVKYWKPDALFCASTSGLSTAILACTGLGTRIVGYRGTQARVSRWDFTNYLALLNPRVDHVVCETPDIVDIMARAGVPARKLSCATKPYSLDWAQDFIAHPKSREDLKSGGSKALICIGHCKNRPHKGLSYLLEAMRQLPDARLTVIGEVDDKDRESAPDNVTFLGSDPKAPYYIPGHDLLMLPSTRDASPRTVREAQACGVPCIVSDIPGARDLIIPGVTGLLVPAGSPDAIAQAVKSLSPERIKQMGQAAREHIRDHFSVDEYVDKIERALQH